MGEAELGWYGVMCAERAAIGAFLVVLEYTWLGLLTGVGDVLIGYAWNDSSRSTHSTLLYLWEAERNWLVIIGLTRFYNCLVLDEKTARNHDPRILQRNTIYIETEQNILIIQTKQPKWSLNMKGLQLFYYFNLPLVVRNCVLTVLLLCWDHKTSDKQLRLHIELDISTDGPTKVAFRVSPGGRPGKLKPLSPPTKYAMKCCQRMSYPLSSSCSRSPRRSSSCRDSVKLCARVPASFIVDSTGSHFRHPGHRGRTKRSCSWETHSSARQFVLWLRVG